MMARPTRLIALITLAAALIAIGGGVLLGRSAGARTAPGLLVEQVEPIDRPKVDPVIPVPTPITIPARLPK
jgi:hypothetical protein